MTTGLAVGILLFAVFAVFAALMYLGKLPALVALPLMSAVMYLIGGAAFLKVNFHFPGSHLVDYSRGFLQVVLEEGMLRMWPYVVTVILGALMAELLKEAGVSKSIIRWASELGGDNKLVVCVLLMLATALLFTSLGGLGAVIMVASIVLPILMSIGVSPTVAGCVFLMGMSLGGAFNVVNWKFYIDFMVGSAGMTPAAAQSEIMKFVMLFIIPFFLVSLLFLAFNVRKGFSSMWAVANKKKEPESNVNALALISPLVPIIPVVGFNVYNLAAHVQGGFVFPINSALVLGVVYTLITTSIGRGRVTQRFTKALFDAIAATAPVAAIIIGIGMIIRVVMDPAVSGYMQPILDKVIPTSRIAYVVVFSLLAPLALYRGPLNMYGMGAALVTIMVATHKLPPVAIMGALYSVGMIQGVCDPTNTHNVWVANFVGADVQTLTKKTILYMWGLAVAGLTLSAVLFMK